MSVSLLIGNGLNRCLRDELAWDNLLRTVAVKHRVTSNSKISLPLEFERICNLIFDKDESQDYHLYGIIKKEICNEISTKLDYTNPKVDLSLHRQFSNLKVSSILTTNYDYILEASFEASFNRSILKASDIYRTETKYNNYRKIVVSNIPFFHIHGEEDRPGTLCLGYEHYIGSLQKLREEFHSKDDERTKSILGGAKQEEVIWADKFFMDEIYIIGFNLHESETDLWWLLTYRAFLYYSNKWGMRKLIKNRIVYYDAGGVADQNKKALLEGLHVEYVQIPETEKNNYRGRYQIIYEKIIDELI